MPNNGKNKKHYIVDADKQEMETLQPGDKLHIKFLAKTYKRIKARTFDAVFVPHNAPITFL